MLGFCWLKRSISLLSASASGPVCVCQKVISTGAVIFTWSTGDPGPPPVAGAAAGTAGLVAAAGADVAAGTEVAAAAGVAAATEVAAGTDAAAGTVVPVGAGA